MIQVDFETVDISQVRPYDADGIDDCLHHIHRTAAQQIHRALVNERNLLVGRSTRIDRGLQRRLDPGESHIQRDAGEILKRAEVRAIKFDCLRDHAEELRGRQLV